MAHHSTWPYYNENKTLSDFMERQETGYRSDRSCESTPAGWELYGLKVDPTESHNLCGDRKLLIQEKLKEQFLDLRAKVKAVEINRGIYSGKEPY